MKSKPSANWWDRPVDSMGKVEIDLEKDWGMTPAEINSAFKCARKAGQTLEQFMTMAIHKELIRLEAKRKRREG
jgi:hypothetical protein